ncbi:ABC transporter ATP-binding protein [Natrinema sp. 1APR25-10V2]|uniref:ABC transporter ATP-binding protein n=1 Tax=Natrinema sp. 1APR25-10V2 TaxID=2951081 RepID=UPI002874A0E3|nr:ABC transporter ATP-binding protein [Natrinema sp. 1APR25-10V2]MDS0478598.1 ABC transporter ATP-binding protein [Natrinema sp. 1APR25-10V2]
MATSDNDASLRQEQQQETDLTVSATGVAKTYDSRIPFTNSVTVLDNATLEVKRGEVVGIMGENGSGKSTLMQILAGVLEHDAGDVSRSGTVGWCPQEPRLYDRLTVDETFELFGRAYGMADTEIEDARNWLTDVLDFKKFRDRQIRNLSGGNRQKVNLSVALMHQPDLLLLDEPYTGFDWETFLAFWDLTEELRERGVGVAIISHIINERDRFDVIYELHDGHLHRQEIGEDVTVNPEPTADGVSCERTATFFDRDEAAGSGQRAANTEEM